MNLVALTGRLTADPTLSKSTTGVSVTAFSIAVARNYKKEGGPEADFIRVIAWRNTAEFICRYFRKGTKIEISGELQSRTYKEKDTGKSRTIMEVVATQASFAESKSNTDQKSGANIPSTGAVQAGEPTQTNKFDEDEFRPIDDDGDLPF